MHYLIARAALLHLMETDADEHVLSVILDEMERLSEIDAACLEKSKEVNAAALKALETGLTGELEKVQRERDFYMAQFEQATARIERLQGSL